MRTPFWKRYRLGRQLPAFSLTELLVVLVIIGILVFLALPNLLPAVTEAKAQEAKINLKHLYNMQRNYYYVHSKYADNFNDINFEPPKSVENGGTANYSYEIIESSKSGFIAIAEANDDFDGDGTRNKWQIDQDMNLTELVKD